MHHLIILVVELCRWIDRRFQKTLKQAVPDLDSLLADPRGTLAGRDITIGPVKRYASGVMLGLLAGLFSDAVIVALFLIVTEGFKPGPHVAFTVMVVLVVLPVLCLWAVLVILRGGRMLLTSGGVELTYGSVAVRCPWALFSAPGQPFQLKDRVLIPVAQLARPFVEVQIGGVTEVTGQVKTRQLRFKSSGEAVLSPLYEVSIIDLAGFLLALGRALNASLPEYSSVSRDESEQEPALVEPPAAFEEDGWIVARLTRLTFPPFCCNCGASTDEVQEYRGFGQLLRIGKLIRIDSAEHARFEVPVCGACRRESRARYLRSIWVGGIFGLVVAAVLGVALALLVRDPFAMICCLVPLGALGFGIGAAAGKRGSAPVELERYSASKGTIAIRFRWRAYGERLVAYMQAQETFV